MDLDLGRQFDIGVFLEFGGINEVWWIERHMVGTLPLQFHGLDGSSEIGGFSKRNNWKSTSGRDGSLIQLWSCPSFLLMPYRD